MRFILSLPLQGKDISRKASPNCVIASQSILGETPIDTTRDSNLEIGDGTVRIIPGWLPLVLLCAARYFQISTPQTQTDAKLTPWVRASGPRRPNPPKARIAGVDGKEAFAPMDTISKEPKGAPTSGAGMNRQKLSIQRALWRALGPLGAEEPGTVALSRATRDGRNAIGGTSHLATLSPQPQLSHYPRISLGDLCNFR